MNTPMRVGLTGGIASGKSTAAQRFAELGVPVIDADVVARQVVEINSVGLTQVTERFGSGVLQADGTLDRAALRKLIFSQPAARGELEDILHPLIQARMSSEASSVSAPYLIMAIPLLVEGGKSKDRVDRVLVVDVPESLQIERLMARDGSDQVQAQAILRSQASRAARLAAADDILENTGSPAVLRSEVDRLHAKYLQLALGDRPPAK